MDTLQVPLGDIIIDKAYQLRVNERPDLIAEWAEAMLEGAIFPPIRLVRLPDQRLLLVDGFHRTNAAKKAKLKEITAIVEDGDAQVALFAAAGANTANGIALTMEDKRKAIRAIFADPELHGLSDREIERRTKRGGARGLSHTFISEQRKIWDREVADKAAQKAREAADREIVTTHLPALWEEGWRALPTDYGANPIGAEELAEPGKVEGWKLERLASSIRHVIARVPSQDPRRHDVFRLADGSALIVMDGGYSMRHRLLQLDGVITEGRTYRDIKSGPQSWPELIGEGAVVVQAARCLPSEPSAWLPPEGGHDWIDGNPEIGGPPPLDLLPPGFTTTAPPPPAPPSEPEAPQAAPRRIEGPIVPEKPASDLVGSAASGGEVAASPQSTPPRPMAEIFAALRLVLPAKLSAELPDEGCMGITLTPPGVPDFTVYVESRDAETDERDRAIEALIGELLVSLSQSDFVIDFDSATSTGLETSITLRARTHLHEARDLLGELMEAGIDEIDFDGDQWTLAELDEQLEDFPPRLVRLLEVLRPLAAENKPQEAADDEVAPSTSEDAQPAPSEAMGDDCDDREPLLEELPVEPDPDELAQTEETAREVGLHEEVASGTFTAPPSSRTAKGATKARTALATALHALQELGVETFPADMGDGEGEQEQEVSLWLADLVDEPVASIKLALPAAQAALEKARRPAPTTTAATPQQPPASERRAETRERGARLGRCIAAARKLRDAGEEYITVDGGLVVLRQVLAQLQGPSIDEIDLLAYEHALYPPEPADAPQAGAPGRTDLIKLLEDRDWDNSRTPIEMPAHVTTMPIRSRAPASWLRLARRAELTEAEQAALVAILTNQEPPAEPAPIQAEAPPVIPPKLVDVQSSDLAEFTGDRDTLIVQFLAMPNKNRKALYKRAKGIAPSYRSDAERQSTLLANHVIARRQGGVS